tara:strand:+ start:87 stop:383 length:297 start_codon:yes stop_codon:yes gene_type:complete
MSLNKTEDEKRNTSPLTDTSGKVRISTIVSIYVQMLNDYIIEVGSAGHKRLKMLQAKLDRGEIHFKPGKITQIERERINKYLSNKHNPFKNKEKNENR